MKKKIIYPFISFVLIFVLHAIYSIWKGIHTFKQWVQIEKINFLLEHFRRQDYLLGISYALAGAFTIYAFLEFLKWQRKDIRGVLGGITLSGVVYLLGCFLIGCCGSPMLVVYLGLFGPSFLGFTKPLILIFTVFSVMVGYFWIKKKSRIQDVCCVRGVHIDASGLSSDEAIKKIQSELQKGMKLLKCKKCGCMKETLQTLRTSLNEDYIDLLKSIDSWLLQMKPIEYSCLGCKYCFPAVAMNIFTSRTFESKPETWPAVAGEYFAFCDGGGCPVAVSTLASVELAERLAKLRPKELCIVGKTETENIGIDKVIKNIITNPIIHFLLLAGKDPEGHHSGRTLLALKENGVDENMRVIGSTGRRPILKNVSRQEIDTFRKQIEVINMLGCEDELLIIEKIKELSLEECSKKEAKSISISQAPVIRVKESGKIQMDKAGYFVIIPQTTKGIITVEHYSYENKLLRVIEGKDAKSIYSLIVEKGWITQLSHAAYLGKELARAELSLKLGFKYIQEGA
ncbi:MAG: DUF4346 domain-containing protein [Candidatus Omnitrophica bacterium]|nr:DUF4346 domain-containing protein [Candidatus Omnitrophota bacterium]